MGYPGVYEKRKEVVKGVTKSKIFLASILSFIAGIGVNSFYKVPTIFLIGIFIFSGLYFIFGFSSFQRKTLLFILIVFTFGLGFWRASFIKEQTFNFKNQSNHQAFIFQIKERFLENLGKILPEPQASLTSALLLGDKTGLSRSFLQDFAKTGTSHIIAISGYNISIISLVVFEILAFLALSRFWRLLLTVASIFIFALVTGLEASVVRAGIMASIMILAWQQGRLYSIFNAVSLAGALMLYFNPGLLRDDLGFQLSFLSILGLIFIDPVFKKFFGKLKFKESFLKFLTPTLSAQLMTFPVIAYNFNQVSLVAPLANLLVLPLVPLTMFFGFTAGAVSFLSLNLARIFAVPAWILLSYEIKVVHLLSLAPFSYLAVGGMSVFLIFIYYLAVSIFILKFYESGDQL